MTLYRFVSVGETLKRGVFDKEKAKLGKDLAEGKNPRKRLHSELAKLRSRHVHQTVFGSEVQDCIFTEYAGWIWIFFCASTSSSMCCALSTDCIFALDTFSFAAVNSSQVCKICRPPSFVGLRMPNAPPASLARSAAPGGLSRPPVSWRRASWRSRAN